MYMEKTKLLLNPKIVGKEAELLESGLLNKIVGQKEAIKQITNTYQGFLSGFREPGRPIANLFFLGPTGSGKTRIVEATSECLFGDSRAVIKIDCAEFQHSHEIAKLIGSPPGYLGHRETHPLLSQETLNQHHTNECKMSLVLFDEIEKASDALWNILLGIMDKATLTLGDNRRVDFSQAIIFLTGNVAAQEITSLVSQNIGFFDPNKLIKNEEELHNKINKTAAKSARKIFSPEFLNRIDKVIVFNSLNEDELEQVLNLELKKLTERVHSSNYPQIRFSLTKAAKEFILMEGLDRRYGARHLKRAINQYISNSLSNLLATGQLEAGDELEIDYSPEQKELTFLNVFLIPEECLKDTFEDVNNNIPHKKLKAAAGKRR